MPLLTPMLMGKKNTRIYWGEYEQRCLDTLGYIPSKGTQLSKMELTAIGFDKAAGQAFLWK